MNKNSYAAALGVLFAHLKPAWFFRWHLVMFLSSYQSFDGAFQIPTWLKDDVPSFENFRKTALTTSDFEEKLRETTLIAFIFVNTILHPRILKNNIDHSRMGEHHHFFIHIPSPYLAEF